MAFQPVPAIVLCVAACLWKGMSASAQSPRPADSARPEDTLTLPARDKQAPPPPPAAAKSVLIPTDEDRQLGNLGDVLERLAGLHVLRTGEFGDYLGVSIQGSSENQVNVYVNGVLKNPGGDPSLFLGDFDLARVERVEIYKGLAPDDLPGSPMGGAINIITRETGRDEGLGLDAALGAGSFGTFRTSGSLDFNRGAWKSHAQATRDQSKGDFPYYDDNGTEFLPGRFPDGSPRRGADDLIRKIRRNNAHGFTELDAALALAPSADAEVGVQADFSSLHKQIPAPYASVDASVNVTAFRESDHLSTRAYGRWGFPNLGLDVAGDLSAGYQGDIFVDTSKAGGAIGLGANDDGNDYSDAAATVSARKVFTDRFTVAALASYGLTGYLLTRRMEGRSYPWLYRYTGEGKLTPTYALGRHTLQAVFGAALHLEEEYRGPGSSGGRTVLPGAGWGEHESARLGYQYRPRDGVWVSAQGGTSYRIPTFFERFGDRGTLLANPYLRPEAGVNASLGLHAESRRSSLDVEAFLSEGRRIITLVPNSQSVSIYRNTGDTRSAGLDADLALTPRPWTRTELALTLQKAENLAGGTTVDDYKLIPYRPRTQATLRQTFTRAGWSLAAFGYYQGETFPNGSNQPSFYDSYSHNTQWQTRCDLTLAWRARKPTRPSRLADILVAAAVRNIFDSRNFDFFNYPLPGRSYAASVQTTF